MSEWDELRRFFQRYKEGGYLEFRGGKPDKAYVWANADPRNIANLKELGFVPCQDPDVKVWNEGGIGSEKPDKTKQIGDAILMEVSRERKEMIDKLKEEKRQEALRMFERIKETFHEEGRKTGVPTFEDESSTEHFKRRRR
jgi:hypothetical protein